MALVFLTIASASASHFLQISIGWSNSDSDFSGSICDQQQQQLLLQLLIQLQLPLLLLLLLLQWQAGHIYPNANVKTKTVKSFPSSKSYKAASISISLDFLNLASVYVPSQVSPVHNAPTHEWLRMVGQAELARAASYIGATFKPKLVGGSCVIAGDGRQEKRQFPHPQILDCQKLSKNLFVRKVSSRNVEFGIQQQLPFWKTLKAKMKFWAPVISAVGNLQLSVRILTKMCSTCRKISTSCSAYFFKPLTPLCMGDPHSPSPSFLCPLHTFSFSSPSLLFPFPTLKAGSEVSFLRKSRVKKGSITKIMN